MALHFGRLQLLVHAQAFSPSEGGGGCVAQAPVVGDDDEAILLGFLRAGTAQAVGKRGASDSSAVQLPAGQVRSCRKAQRTFQCAWQRRWKRPAVELMHKICKSVFGSGSSSRKWTMATAEALVLRSERSECTQLGSRIIISGSGSRRLSSSSISSSASAQLQTQSCGATQHALGCAIGRLARLPPAAGGQGQPTANMDCWSYSV